MIAVFTNYQEWHTAITERCGLTLSREYCTERIAVLADESVPSTHGFIRAYGEEYLRQVIDWFRRAQEEATS